MVGSISEFESTSLSLSEYLIFSKHKKNFESRFKFLELD